MPLVSCCVNWIGGKWGGRLREGKRTCKPVSVFEPAANFRRRGSFGEEPRAMVRPEGKVRVLRWAVLVLWKGMVGWWGVLVRGERKVLVYI